MIKVITMEREYGSGGPAIAQKLADRMGWTLWDRMLTREIARLANCDLAAVECREERKDSLYYRLFKSFLRGSFEANLQVHRLKLLDADRIVAISKKVVQEAAAAGQCVIVGRGSQYFLQGRHDTYHVFIYAPFEEKIRREMHQGKSKSQARNLVETVDRERAGFIKKYFSKQWPNHSLYHLMVNSAVGDDAVVESIVSAVVCFDKAREARHG
ncbi:MAG: AAA family ATPase [Alphaproteobacteria bacterium]